MSDRKSIGLSDRTGREIFEGDVVEFYFRATQRDLSDAEYSDGPREGFTRMVDRVEIRDGEAYFIESETGLGSFAWRHNEHCRVIELEGQPTIEPTVSD